jgi:tetratricopeptide (TPR) repeat protein
MLRSKKYVFLVLLACALRSPAQQRPFSIPEKKGALIITPGMEIQKIELLNDDSQLRATWQSNANLMTMTAFIQPAERRGDGKTCRDTWWPQTESGITRLATIKYKKLREQDGIALVEYTVDLKEAVNQKHVHAYLAGGDVWAEVHISKVQFKPEDQPLFDAIVNSLRLNADYVNNSRDYWRWGAISSNNTEYEKAMRYFQKSLDLEKNSPMLDQAILRRMIADLGHFYEKFGDLARARTTLEYGLSKYPDYSLYHFNLACVIALTQKMDESLAELRLAYQKRKNTYPEEQPLPDPLTTDCFARFAKEPKFIQAVREMQM